jgi:hypothetical protein
MTIKQYLKEQAPVGFVDKCAQAALIGMLGNTVFGVDQIDENCNWAYAYAMGMVKARMKNEPHIGD